MDEKRLQAIENDPGRYALEVRQIIAEVRRLRSIAERALGLVQEEFDGVSEDHSTVRQLRELEKELKG